MLENKYEKIYWKDNKYIMGIDEAGRGPLAGPLVVASCILPINYNHEGINDSKKLSEKKRKALFLDIIKDAKYFEFKIISPKIIDELNIYAATKKAMEELKNNSKIQAITLTDAMKLEDDNVIPIIKGDAKSINIAAASILAKVLRDHIMQGYHILYPQYEFNKHKGYPTKRHLELMEEYGLLDIYRFSYGPCKEIKLF